MILNIVKFLVGLLIFFSFLYINHTMIDPDLGWHLRVGEEILATKTVPHLDLYSWTMPNFEWVDHEWLVDSWLAWMENNNLWIIVVFLFSFIVSFPFLFWVSKSNHLLKVALILIAVISSISFVGVRPQILSFFLFFLLFNFLQKFNLGNIKSYLVLPPLFLFWANIHAGFFAGLALLGLYIFSMFIERILNINKISNKQLLSILFVFIASAVAALINPYGFNLYKEIFTVFFSSETMKYILEWQPLLSVFDFSKILIIGIIIAFFIRFYKKYSFFMIIAGIFFMALSLKSSRNWLLFLVVAIPVIFKGLDFIREEIKNLDANNNFNEKIKKVLIIFYIGVTIFILFLWGYKLYSYQSIKLPEDAINFMRQNINSGQFKGIKLLNTYGWGGYLIQEMPGLKVFIDGRMPHWIDENNNSAMRDYIDIFYSDNISSWKNIFERRNIDTVLIENDFFDIKRSYLDEQSSYLLDQISNFLFSKKQVNLKKELLMGGWEVLYEDEVAIIFKKTDSVLGSGQK